MPINNINNVNGDIESAVTTEEDSLETVNKILIDKLSGIEAIPYQFMPNVDTRILGTSVGRKYSEKIVARLPLLFLTPCDPLFMDDFDSSDKLANDKNTVIDWLFKIGEGDPNEELIHGKGKYYSVEYAYADYYNYLNAMLTSVATFLGIYNEKIPSLNKKEGSPGKYARLGTVDWQKELNPAFKTFFSASENVIFYLDGLNSVSENYSNDTTESSLASQINGFSDTANEIKFLFGSKGSALGNIIDDTTAITSSIGESLSGVIGRLGGGIVGSLADSGVNTVLNGGKIVFPKIWSNSSTSRSYSLDIKLRSPDHDSISIFLNVLKPYCKLLALCLPRMMENGNPNGYRAPFMVKAFSKGLFNIDYGMITDMSVTKGAECCWNDDGLPTQIDISITIEDLYSSLAMSGFGEDWVSHIVSNTSYMDFLANMAGLNIAQMEIGRRLKMFYYLSKTNLIQTPSRVFTRFDQNISKLLGKLYDFTS